MKCEPENSRRGEALRSTLLLLCENGQIEKYRQVRKRFSGSSTGSVQCFRRL
jgi:hypothetical protein